MKLPRKLLIICGIIFTVYIGFYLIDSRLGGYWLKPDRDGRHHYSMGLSMPAAIQWQPKWGYQSSYSSDLIGKFLYPLIQIDRHFLHQTKYITDESTFDWLRFANPSEIHPIFRADFVRDQRKAEQGAAANP